MLKVKSDVQYWSEEREYLLVGPVLEVHFNAIVDNFFSSEGVNSKDLNFHFEFTKKNNFSPYCTEVRLAVQGRGNEPIEYINLDECSDPTDTYCSGAFPLNNLINLHHTTRFQLEYRANQGSKAEIRNIFLAVLTEEELENL